MEHRIEPALLPGYLVHEADGHETIGLYDDHTAADTLIEQLADAAGIDLEQAEAALEWMKSEDRTSEFEIAGAILGRLFGLIIPPEGNIRLDLIGQKFLAVHFLLNRNGTATLTGIAERAGVSKQLLDHHAVTMGGKLGFHGVGQKREGAREAYASVQREIWSKLSPEQRRQRRAGKSAQSSSNDQI